MLSEYQVETLRGIRRKQFMSFGRKIDIDLTPALDMAQKVIEYDREEREQFEKMNGLKDDLKWAEQKFREARERKELAFGAFEQLLPEGKTLKSVSEEAEEWK